MSIGLQLCENRQVDFGRLGHIKVSQRIRSEFGVIDVRIVKIMEDMLPFDKRTVLAARSGERLRKLKAKHIIFGAQTRLDVLLPAGFFQYEDVQRPREHTDLINVPH